MTAAEYPQHRPDQVPPPPPDGGQQPFGNQPYPPPPPGYGGQPMPGVPAYAAYAQPQGPIGQIRPNGLTILLFFVTLGIWGLV